ncbi:MAG: SGNH/GDSL hydrolase family protein [bacterium]
MRYLVAVCAALAVGAAGCDDGGGSGGDGRDDMAVLGDASADGDQGVGGAGGDEGDQGVGGAGGDEADQGADEGVEGDEGVEPDGATPDPFEGGGECGASAAGKAVAGFVYDDTDGSDRSRYAFEIGPEDTLRGDEPVAMFGVDGALEARYCDDGSYVFDGLGEGVYLITATPDEGELCSQRNCTRRFARAMADGGARMVTFGDSIAVVGTAGTTLFPDRVVELFAPLGRVESRNVAVGGSTSREWLPGTRNFENNLRPQLAEADVIVVTLGGNDVMQYIGSFGGIPDDIPAAVQGARDVVLEVIANLVVILDEVRSVNADADILYILYADYTQATRDPIWGLVGNLLGRETLQGVLELARDSLPEDPTLVLADMFGAAQGLPLHEFLEDPLHFNDRGHTLYAQEVFVALGGVLMGDNPLLDGESPLGTRRSFGFRAVGAVEAEAE